MKPLAYSTESEKCSVNFKEQHNVPITISLGVLGVGNATFQMAQVHQIHQCVSFCSTHYNVSFL
jgi:hypothetical protein